VKSTGLFATDEVLKSQRRQDRLLEDRPQLHQAQDRRAGRAGRLREERPLLLQPADRRGYDDGLVAAAAILAMLDRNPGQEALGPEEGPAGRLHLANHEPALRRREKYGLVDEGGREYTRLRDAGGTILGRKIVDLITVNGVRVRLEDGSWVWSAPRPTSPRSGVWRSWESIRSPTTDMRAPVFSDEVKAAPVQAPSGGRLQPGNLSGADAVARWSCRSADGPAGHKAQPCFDARGDDRDGLCGLVSGAFFADFGQPG
jgi:phosphomannomutase/phosphoglucomutase